MVGMLALFEGPELLDRKWCGEQVLDISDCDLPPSCWPPAPSTLHPPGCPSWMLRTRKMDLLTFPRYNPSDIITHIRNQILTGSEAKNLSKNDLFPNPKMPVTVDIMYPQIVEGFLPICNLYINMERFLPVCRINDFQLADVINPKAKRTARFLSGILNFIHFQESRREIYMEFQWAYKSALEKIQQLQTANQEAAVKLEKLDTIPVEQKAEFKQLSDDIKELQQVLNQDYRQKTTALQEVTSQKKAEVAERTRSLNQLKVTMATLKEEQEQLKSKIVESPEELKNYKEHMKETVQKLKKTKQEVIEKFEGYRDLVEILPSCQLEVQLYQKKMQSQGANVERMANISSEVRNLEDQIENGQIELKNAATDEMSLKRLVNAKREKLSTAEIRIKKKQEDVEQYKRTVFEYCNRVQEKRGAVYEKVTVIHKEIQQVRFKVQQLNENTEKEKMKAQKDRKKSFLLNLIIASTEQDLEVFLSIAKKQQREHEEIAKMSKDANF
ncbi:Kinetochore protein Nuf2 [Chelonia mydas]|uniref:Kinetochore protein Nuf2 n=1 Tax=Chelonia mydas TaxID=8469 RepID=M7BQZ9_CHEMY|nr:Kinetochore protein Nuf2 [Chelonia mydas]